MELTGRKFLYIMVGAFSVIITVNLFMAYSALSTFPGLEVKNSYVASQNWNDDRAAQLALGWDVSATVEDGELEIAITGEDGYPVEVNNLTGIFGMATNTQRDQTPEFTFTGTSYVAPVEAETGNWNFRMRAEAADGTPFQQRIVILIR